MATSCSCGRALAAPTSCSSRRSPGAPDRSDGRRTPRSAWTCPEAAPRTATGSSFGTASTAPLSLDKLWQRADLGRSRNQLFRLSETGTGPIRWAAHPGKCLDVTDGSVADGTPLQLWDCGGAAANQRFRAEHVRSINETAVRDIYFGTGRVEGIAATDTMRFAGIQLERQRLLVVEKEVFSPPAHVWDGILGLAKTEYSSIGAPFFTRLRDVGVAPLFVFVPTHTQSGTHVELRIGNSALRSPEIAQSTITWVPSKERGLWYINGSVGVRQRSKRRFLVDTGTTVIVMPPGDLRAYVDAVQPRRGCLVERRRVLCACSDVPSMMPLMFEFGNVTMALGALDLFQPTKKAMGGSFGAEPACELQVSVGEEPEGWLLGDNFLRKVAVAFDYEQRRVGFAAPVEQSSLELRVVNGPGGPVVQTRMSRHATVMKRQWRGTLVHLSAQLRGGDVAAKGVQSALLRTSLRAATVALPPFPLLLVVGAGVAFAVAWRRSLCWGATVVGAAASSPGPGEEFVPLSMAREGEC
uniref:Peptidase A1 domain-containing protein n=1 Tax=Alexandrium monilatum TaxID=311494 RepID=A0A7S4Q274_9DINO